MNDNRLAIIANFVKNRLDGWHRISPQPDKDPVYRYEHTLRVAQYGRQLSQSEGADIELVIAACLLHDVAHFDPQVSNPEHGRAGVEVARPLLDSLGYTSDEVDNICYSIGAHVNAKKAHELLHTLEARCVSDADNIDRFGAYRFLQHCVCESNMGNMEKLATDLSAHLVQLEKYRTNLPLYTPTGKALFARQLELQIAIFKALVEEWKMTRLPEI